MNNLKTKDGRIILAEGEVTGHLHEVRAEEELSLPMADFFEDPATGVRTLMALGPCVLTHHQHGAIPLHSGQQFRQGDVFLNPVGENTWHVIRQVEELPDGLRQVAD